jgi:hypothetical protein
VSAFTTASTFLTARSSTEEQRKIRALETDIEGLKLRIRKAKKLLRLLEGQ